MMTITTNKTDVRSIWSACMSLLESRVDKVDYESFFVGIEPVKVDRIGENRYSLIITLPCVGDTFREWFDKKFVKDLGYALHQVLGKGASLHYQDAKSKVVSGKASPTNTVVPKEHFQQDSAQDAVLIYSKLKDIGFESFVVGESNRGAFSIAQEVCHSVLKGQSLFSPLYIYGKVGLGKTHLACAVGNQIKKKDPSQRIFYSQSNEFMNLYVQSVRGKTVSEFISNFDAVDVLILDDIQSISNKNGMQQVIFQIFEKIHSQGNGKQIIITSDVPSAELQDIEERLISRLKWGVSVHLNAPDVETRKKIVQSKIESSGKNIELDAKLIDLLVHEMRDCNIREMEGVINKVMVQTITQKKDPDEALVRMAISEVISSAKTGGNIRIEDIIRATCQYLEVDKQAIESKAKNRKLVEARQIAMYLCAKYTKASLKEIGKHFKKDHSTVIYSRNSIQSAIDIYPDVEKKVQEVLTILGK